LNAEGKKQVKAEIKVPAVGESISEATIGEWTKKSGEFVKRDEVILVLETDKASVEVVAPVDGALATLAKAGDVVKIGAVVASIDTEGVATAGMPAPGGPRPSAESAPSSVAPAPIAPGAPAPATPGAPSGGTGREIAADLRGRLSPAVRRVVEERGVDPAQVAGTGKDGRLTKADAEAAASRGLGATSVGLATVPGAAPRAVPDATPARASASQSGDGRAPAGGPAKAQPLPPLPRAARGPSGAPAVQRVAMTTIRKRIAERLVQSQHTAAILTTFNEIDMTQVIAFRERYRDRYKEKYGVSLGFMGIFVKAAIEALKEVPGVNATIEGSDILYKNYYNIGVAVSTEKGLVVPVVRDADLLSVAEVEQSIRHYALKARDGKLAIDDLSDGTFTISNGGVFGSLMSTPILNPPQSGILGMHKVQDRPMAIGGKVEIRPMMYAALSYDHRLVDGREAVTFLVKIKECVEAPERILLGI
jgi:2-oxoglutarate dehydrogenase E2 component (dihydrolipoamide succinyltransferase)